MDAQWCKQTLEEAVEIHVNPEIINTDQGSQFTCEVFGGYVLAQDIALSMDGKGRVLDNAFIERLWRSVKYEKLYLNSPDNGTELHLSLAEYFTYYTTQRRHLGIDNSIPHLLYRHTQPCAA